MPKGTLAITVAAGLLAIYGCGSRVQEEAPPPDIQEPTPLIEEGQPESIITISDTVSITTGEDATIVSDGILRQPGVDDSKTGPLVPVLVDTAESAALIPVATADTSVSIEVPAVEVAPSTESTPGAEPTEPVQREVLLESDREIPQRAAFDIEQSSTTSLLADSVRYDYMIRPLDNLTKIAFKEYRNPNEWRRIYRWNRERIGENPNYILPFHELDLFKPAGEVRQWSYDFTLHKVKTGETLWEIAGKYFKDNRAWIVLYWDNEVLLASNGGRLKVGMELKVRTQLWPENP